MNIDILSCKGIFPHKFVNEKTLNYIGPKPDIKYYLDSSKINDQKLAVYDNIPNEFNLKEQCLDYLNKDVLGLLEVMIKLNEYYYSKFNINITKYPTIASLTIGVYGYWFSKDIKNPIKMIKGPLEKFIRQAYFGGNSEIFVSGKDRFVKAGFHYDMNSQYPFAMKKPMPTGNPVFSNNTDLNFYTLGFVFAKIIPPSEDRLKNLFIQRRNEDGSVSCPRETFYEYISTVDLRYGIESGYKAEIICGVNFPDACDDNVLFGNFVDYFYQIKSTTNDDVEKGVAKLTVNSASGKFGQKEAEYTIKLVDTNEKDDIIGKHHYSYLSKFSDNKYLIKYGPKLNEKLRQLYSHIIDTANNFYVENDKLDFKFKKERGIASAVQISAMITSYGRVSINPLKLYSWK